MNATRPITQIGRWFLASALLFVTALSGSAQPIPGQYIAVFKQDVPDPTATARDLENQHGISVSYVYRNSIRGFAFAGNEQAAQALARHPRIAYVEQDQIAEANVFPADPIPTGVSRIGVDSANVLPAILSGSSWQQGSNGKWGVNARIAIIDTGLDPTHPDLNVDPNGVRPFFKTVKGKTVLAFDNNFIDDNGHGTHVGGTAAANGAIVGVAPGASLTAVKVLGANGSGQFSIIIAGVDWVADNTQHPPFDAANMSLGGGFSQAVNDAVRNAVAKGIVFAVAAGNAGTDVSEFSPASAESAITVSAMLDYDGQPGGFGTPLDAANLYVSCKNSDGTGGTPHRDEEFPCFSNYGKGVDICAPGVRIYSTWPRTLGDLSGYNTISGTSMATPHVAGAAALYIARNRTALSADGPTRVSEVTKALKDSGWRVGDYGYLDYFTREPFTVRSTGDKDTVREPLLNVAALLGYSPRPDITVSIYSPAPDAALSSAESITFTATALQDPDDKTPSIMWISNLDGVLNPKNSDGSIITGGSVSKVLTVGTHTVVASVPDSVTTFGGAAEVNIVVGEPTPAPKQLSITITFNKPNDPVLGRPVYYDGETMVASHWVTDELGAPVAGASVRSVMTTPNGGTLTASGTTDAAGRYDAPMKMNGKRGGGYGAYSITASATKTGYLRSADVQAKFELK